MTFNKRKNLLSRLKKGLPIYGEKENEKFGRLNKREVGKLLVEVGVFDVKDLKRIPKYAWEALMEYTKDSFKKVRDRLSRIGTMRDIEVPVPTSDPRDNFENLMYYENLNSEASLEEEREQAAREGDEAAIDDDKWTVLRRLAKEDPTLNINRSYASDTLHEMERMIVQGKRDKNGNPTGEKFTKDELYDEMVTRLKEIKAGAKEREDTLTSFFELDPGFHGEEKTKARIRAAEKRAAKERARMEIEDYE